MVHTPTSHNRTCLRFAVFGDSGVPFAWVIPLRSFLRLPRSNAVNRRNVSTIPLLITNQNDSIRPLLTGLSLI
jgi:hypothetical protein